MTYRRSSKHRTSSTRALSDGALDTLERELTEALDLAWLTGAWRTDKRAFATQQILLDEVREERFHRVQVLETHKVA